LVTSPYSGSHLIDRKVEVGLLTLGIYSFNRILILGLNDNSTLITIIYKCMECEFITFKMQK